MKKRWFGTCFVVDILIPALISLSHWHSIDNNHHLITKLRQIGVMCTTQGMFSFPINFHLPHLSVPQFPDTGEF